MAIPAYQEKVVQQWPISKLKCTSKNGAKSKREAKQQKQTKGNTKKVKKNECKAQNAKYTEKQRCRHHSKF